MPVRKASWNRVVIVVLTLLLLAGSGFGLYKLLEDDGYSSAESLADDLGELGLTNCGGMDYQIVREVIGLYRFFAREIGGSKGDQILCGLQGSNDVIFIVVWDGSTPSRDKFRELGSKAFLDGIGVFGPNWLALTSTDEFAQEASELTGGEVVRAQAD